MTLSYFRTTLLAALFILAGPLAICAQTNGDDDSSDYSDPDGGERNETLGASSAAPASTTSVVSSIDAARNYCKLIASAYAIDCVAERLGELAKELEGQDGFEDVQAVLEATSLKLNGIARQNRSSEKDPARFSSNEKPPVKTTRRLIPVDDAKLESAASQAIMVIAEAETLLLRSAEESTERSIQYQRIASALGSNKVLLRSI